MRLLEREIILVKDFSRKASQKSPLSCFFERVVEEAGEIRYIFKSTNVNL